MASTRDLKKRIVSTKNTQQTTKAMKMVSAAKLRRAQDAILAQRPYALRVSRLIHRLTSTSETPFESPLIRKEESSSNGKKALLVLVTSDRGLCGGFNGYVIKAGQRWLAAEGRKFSEVSMSFVGRKGYDFFKTKKVNVKTYYAELGGKVSMAKARKLADSIVGGYLAGEYDEVHIIYNEFKNAVTQKVVVEPFLPLQGLPTADAADLQESEQAFIVRPDPRTVLEDLLGKHFGVQTLRIMLESQAGEHGARMSAMENATKNAEEMVRALTLEYNKQRQAGITKELLEIIAGSESQKAS